MIMTKQELENNMTKVTGIPVEITVRGKRSFTFSFEGKNETAEIMYNKNQDGLTKKWIGRVWLNPPYSRPLIEQFVKRLAEHGNGIALLFNRCDSKMFQDVIFEKATAMKFLRNRIRFFRPDGTRGDSPGCGSILIAFGEENAEILRTCDIAGKYVRIN